MSKEGETSSYNEAEKKMDRLHESQRIINTCRLNLLHLNPDSQLYNYQIMASELLSLLAEIRGKMADDEKKKYCEFREKITDFFDFENVYEDISSQGFGGTVNGRKLNRETWMRLRKLLFDIEDFTRDTLDLRGFSSFNVDDDEGDAY